MLGCVRLTVNGWRLTATYTVLTVVLGGPLSWHKLQLDECLDWIGRRQKTQSKQNNFYHPFSPLEVEGIIEKEIRHEYCLCLVGCMSLFSKLVIDLLGWSCVIYLIGLKEDSWGLYIFAIIHLFAFIYIIEKGLNLRYLITANQQLGTLLWYWQGCQIQYNTRKI